MARICTPHKTSGLGDRQVLTEYSSAKVGVHPPRFSKLELFLGVWKAVGLGNWPEVGVCVGVGG